MLVPACSPAQEGRAGLWLQTSPPRCISQLLTGLKPQKETTLQPEIQTIGFVPPRHSNSSPALLDVGFSVARLLSVWGQGCSGELTVLHAVQRCWLLCHSSGGLPQRRESPCSQPVAHNQFGFFPGDVQERSQTNTCFTSQHLLL